MIIPEATAEPSEDLISPDAPLYSLVRLKSVKRSNPAAVESYCELYSHLAYDCIKDGSLDIATARKYFLEGLDEKLERAVQEKLERMTNRDVSLQIIKAEILSSSRDLWPLGMNQRDRTLETREGAWTA